MKRIVWLNSRILILISQNCVDAIEEAQDTGHTQAVIDKEPLSAVGEQSCRFHQGEVLGDGGEVGADQRLQFTDALFSLGQGFHYEQAAWVGHGFQHPCFANDERIRFNHNTWYNSQLLIFVKEARGRSPSVV